MPSTKPRMTKTLFLALLSVLVIATGLITSCNKQSPGPGPTPEMAPEGETIIIIKGGSVEVGFDETKYVNDKPNHYGVHPVKGKWNGHQPEAVASRKEGEYTDQSDHLQGQFGFRFLHLFRFHVIWLRWR